MRLLCHSSSGTSGEEEKGQSQEVDQKVSCASLQFISFFLFGDILHFYYEEVTLNLRSTSFILRSNACFLKVSHVCVYLAGILRVYGAEWVIKDLHTI